MRVVLYGECSSASGAVGPQDSLEVEVGQQGVTVRDLLRWMVEHHGLQIGHCLERGLGRLTGGVTVTLNRRDVEYLDGLETLVGPDDEVAIVGKVAWLGRQESAPKRTAILRFYGPLATRFRLAAGAPYEVVVETGLSLRGVIKKLSADFGPEVSNWLLDPNTGGLRHHVGVAINGRYVDRTREMDSVISPSDQVTVIEFIAGVAGG